MASVGMLLNEGQKRVGTDNNPIRGWMDPAIWIA